MDSESFRKQVRVKHFYFAEIFYTLAVGKWVLQENWFLVNHINVIVVIVVVKQNNYNT